MRKVKSVTFNWRPDCSPVGPGWSGEIYDSFKVGESGVKTITENEPKNGFQVWNYEIEMEDGTMYRIFNPNLVLYFPESKGETGKSEQLPCDHEFTHKPLGGNVYCWKCCALQTK